MALPLKLASVAPPRRVPTATTGRRLPRSTSTLLPSLSSSSAPVSAPYRGLAMATRTRSRRHLPMAQCGPDKHRQPGSSAFNIAHMPLPSAFSHSVLSSQKPVPMTLHRPGDIVLPPADDLARLSAANSPINNMFRCSRSEQNRPWSRLARRTRSSYFCSALRCHNACQLPRR